MGIHRLLHSSCCFLNTNTAITQQLIGTARMLEAWIRGQRKMSQVLGAFGLLDITMLRPVVTWHAFWNLWTFISLMFQIFSDRGKPRILNPRIQGSTCTLFLGFIHLVASKQNTKFLKLDVCKFYANIWAGAYWVGSDTQNTSTLVSAILCYVREWYSQQCL